MLAQPWEQLMQLWSYALWHLLCFNQVQTHMHSVLMPEPEICCVPQPVLLSELGIGTADTCLQPNATSMQSQSQQ